MQTTKICRRCGKEKPAGEFNRKSSSPDGLQSYCKECVKEYRFKATPPGLKTDSRSPEYSGVADRVLQERAKSLLGELRARGWRVECEIAYLHKKKL